MFTLMLTIAPVFAGWTQAEGTHYAKLGARGVVGTYAFPASGSTALDAADTHVEVEPFNEWALQAYLAYGLTDRWTLIYAGTPIGYARYADASSAYAGANRVGVKRGLLAGQHNVAVQANAGYTPPLGREDLAEGSLEDQGLVFVPCEPTASLGAELHYGLGFGRNWVFASVGYDHLFAQDLDPVVAGQVQIGRTGKRGNRVDFHVPYRFPLGTIEEPANLMGTGQTRYVGFGLGYTHTFGDGFGLGTSFEAIFLAAANASALTLPLALEHQG